jgi:hypothetical protein
VLVAIDTKAQILEIPAGERARGLTDIFLGIVAHAHGEQLHNLASEVLVRRALHVHAGVEESQHGRILTHTDHQIAEISRGFGLKQIELPQHLAIVTHLLFIGGEMAMPEQRHLLFQGAISGQHAIGPPIR